MSAYLNSLGPGRHALGAGLSFEVRPLRSGTRKFFLYRWKPEGDRYRSVIIGNYPEITLEAAKAKAILYAEQRARGVEPGEERTEKVRRGPKVAAKKRGVTFKEYAHLVHDELSPRWKNPKHRTQWINTLNDYLFPKLGKIPINEIKSPEVLNIVVPLAAMKYETGLRVTQRFIRVMSHATARGVIRENPFNSLIKELPKRPEVQNMRALSYEDIPEFYVDMAAKDATQGWEPIRLAFLYLIHTGARTIEVRNLTWDMVNLQKKVIRIPKALMKRDTGGDHSMVITPQIEAILEEAKAVRREGIDLVFPSRMQRQPVLSENALLSRLKRTKWHGRTTVHGMRSAFQTWALETMDDLRYEIIDAHLAHTERNAVRRAYNRAKYWEDRVKLAHRWSDYVTSAVAK